LIAIEASKTTGFQKQGKALRLIPSIRKEKNPRNSFEL
jgi:hypothetical protein